MVAIVKIGDGVAGMDQLIAALAFLVTQMQVHHPQRSLEVI
jgi:hypothetical protein